MLRDLYQKPFPILEINDAFYLREQSLEDTEAFFAYYTDPQVGQYILATKPNSPMEASAEIHYCRNMFYQHRGLYWTLARKDNNQMIGAIGLYINAQHHRAEICYDLAKEYWRQGIMTQALYAAIKFCFEQMGIKRLEALTVKENVPSMSVLYKHGFAREGTLRNYRYFQNASHDVEIFGLTYEMFCEHHKQAACESETL